MIAYITVNKENQAINFNQLRSMVKERVQEDIGRLQITKCTISKKEMQSAICDSVHFPAQIFGPYGLALL